MAYSATYHLTNMGANTPGVSLANTNTSTGTVYDHEGVLVETLPDEIVIAGARREQTLSSTLTTHSVTVEAGRDYQVSCEGANASTVVLSGAATGTLANDGTNRQAFDTAKTATTTTLTCTITGAFTSFQVQDVTGRSNTAPSELLAIGTDYGYGVNGVKYYDTINSLAVNSSNIVYKRT